MREGFGVETDLRDRGRQLVVAHDAAGDDALPAERLFEIYRDCALGVPLALNIKADGLSRMLQRLLERHGIVDYFCFDMSGPEIIAYSKTPLRFFTRQSEYEREPILYSQAAGIWLDIFDGDWITVRDILTHAEAGKSVALVSPELHGRDHRPLWERLRSEGLAGVHDLMLCTDFPREAREFFHG